MGTLQFASRSHVNGYLGEMPISDESQTHFREYVAEKGFTLQQADAMAAGTATFHSGWTLHSAPPNFSERQDATGDDRHLFRRWHTCCAAGQ